VIDPVRMDLTPEGVRLNLADGVHSFTPGTYRLDTPVAVGTAGVAGARESVVFQASAASRIEVRGDAALFLALERAQRFLGPGTVHLEGALELTDATGTRSVARLDAAAGGFDLTVTRVQDGWTIEGRIGGPVTAA
jgi:hypothetical protein